MATIEFNAATQSSAKAKEQVLIVENRLGMQRLLISYFLGIGIDAVVAKDVDEANDILVSDSLSFDLLVVDITNCEQKSVEFCSKIRERQSVYELPMLFITSNPNPISLQTSFNAGCNDYISLPYTTAEFEKKVRMLIGTKRLEKQKSELRNLIDIRTQVFKMNTHDLKNPLSSIFSLSGMPADSFANADELNQTLEVIHNAAKIMMSLVNSNLEFLTISSGSIKLNKELIDVISLINQVVEINNPLAKAKNQTLSYEYPQQDCYIIGDHNKVFQAVNNIVGNAIKFSQREKHIWVNVSNDHNKGNVVIIVKDEGPGFKKEEVDTVFTKFGKHSATPTGDEISTGLGLLITKQIINLVGGEIYLESEEGKGSTFTIEFASASPNEINTLTEV